MVDVPVCGVYVCVLMLQTCVSDLKRVSAENTAARNECADVSQQLSVLQSKSMVVDLQEALRVLHVKVCVAVTVTCCWYWCDVGGAVCLCS